MTDSFDSPDGRTYSGQEPGAASGQAADASLQAAAEVLYRDYDSQYNADHLSWRDFADLARNVITAWQAQNAATVLAEPDALEDIAEHPEAAQAASGDAWWVCDGPLTAGGIKIIGPFESQDLALKVRSYVEKAEGHERLWVDDDEPAGDVKAAPELAAAKLDRIRRMCEKPGDVAGYSSGSRIVSGTNLAAAVLWVLDGHP